MEDTQNQKLPYYFGNYVLIRKIALGGMAEIFKAREKQAGGFGKDMVIKRILPHFLEDEAFIKMFLDEAAITSKLNHPNIVQIYDFDLTDGSYYIAMELIEGVDLKKVIDLGVKSGRPLSVAQAVWITIELAKGLHYAHTREHRGEPLNIVHRDISPHNAMVSYNGDVKLMDFGIAKAAQRSTKTMAGTVKGKVAYMSPEQARGKQLDGRSDLFALAIVLWEMLTGKRLFLGDTDFETLTNVLKNDAPPPSQLNPRVPAALDAIILKALQKDRDHRYPDVDGFCQALTRWYYQNVQNLEAESLRGYMQQLFAGDIRQLQVLNEEERRSLGLPPSDPPRAAVIQAKPTSNNYLAPSFSEDKTVAYDDHISFSEDKTLAIGESQMMATMLEGSLTPEDIRRGLASASPYKSPVNAPVESTSGAGLPALVGIMPDDEEEGGNGKFIVILIIAAVVIGAGVFFLLR